MQVHRWVAISLFKGLHTANKQPAAAGYPAQGRSRISTARNVSLHTLPDARPVQFQSLSELAPTCPAQIPHSGHLCLDVVTERARRQRPQMMRAPSRREEALQAVSVLAWSGRPIIDDNGTVLALQHNLQQAPTCAASLIAAVVATLSNVPRLPLDELQDAISLLAPQLITDSHVRVKPAVGVITVAVSNLVASCCDCPCRGTLRHCPRSFAGVPGSKTAERGQLRAEHGSRVLECKQRVTRASCRREGLCAACPVHRTASKCHH